MEDEMFALLLAGLAIFIFLLSLLLWTFQQWMTSKPGSMNEKITIVVSSLTALFAFLAAAAAVASGWIFYGQLEEMREERRAWVGPISAGFQNGLPQAGSPATVSVQYHNTGREPATDVSSDLSPYLATLTEDLERIPTAHIAQYVTKCRTMQPVIGAQTVFPTTGFSAYTASKVIEQLLIDWNILYGTSFLYITGCYVYNPLGVTHRTSFCFWFQNGPKMTSQSWAFCPTGNYAD